MQSQAHGFGRRQSHLQSSYRGPIHLLLVGRGRGQFDLYGFFRRSPDGQPGAEHDLDHRFLRDGFHSCERPNGISGRPGPLLCDAHDHTVVGNPYTRAGNKQPSPDRRRRGNICAAVARSGAKSIVATRLVAWRTGWFCDRDSSSFVLISSRWRLPQLKSTKRAAPRSRRIALFAQAIG
jgi:hypothetical protein